jgi:light-regulated signal transduction histidine kinase (bacteriophytochrome)
MEAKAGEWFSLRWDIIDFYDSTSFQQYDSAPRFLFAEQDSKQIESSIINIYDRIRLVSIEVTSVFIQEQDVKLPTHYRVGEFMPGDQPKYDSWLAKHHSIIYTASEKIRNREQLLQRKIYLDHTAKVIRHDMHSGINTYLPRGLNGLLQKLPENVIKKYGLKSEIHLLEQGLEYTQKVYKGVHAFTGLVRDGNVEKEKCNVEQLLIDHIKLSAYYKSVEISPLPEMKVHKVLFITAIDNLIKGGITNNFSKVKKVSIYMESENVLCIKDNGAGLSKNDFIKYCKPYFNENENYQGLELNIAVAIIEEHGFSIEPEKLEEGTIFRINIKEGKKHIIDNREWKG